MICISPILQKEISELTGDSRLDGNGNPVNGTGISQARKDEMERYKTDEYTAKIKTKYGNIW